MDSSGTSTVQYDRWNEDNINMNVEATQSTTMRWAEKIKQPGNII